MTKISNIFDKKEKEIMKKWCGDDVCILLEIDKKCYLINMNGNLTFEECFGVIPKSKFEIKQRYLEAKPLRILKYRQYYLLENENEENEWYVGEEMKNDTIEFYKCCETLEDALASL